MKDQRRDEFLRLMLGIATANRDDYREVRRECWERVARSHGEKTDEERANWTRNCS